MSTGKWSQSTIVGRRRVVDQAFAAMGDLPVMEKDQMLAEYVGVGPGTAQRWRKHTNVPRGDAMTKIHAFIVDMGAGGVVSKPKPNGTASKQTAHSATVQAVHALLDHLTFGEMLALSKSVSARVVKLHQERND